MEAKTKQLFLDDFRPGQIFAGASRCVTKGDVKAFAALTGDKHPIHYDDDYARATRDTWALIARRSAIVCRQMAGSMK
jgi:acyl dehydratase